MPVLAVGQQLGDEAARHDGALVDVEGHALQPGFAGEVGGGLAGRDAPRDERFGLARSLGRRRRASATRLEFVERQAERPEHQPGGLVEGVGGAVAEGDAAPLQALGLTATTSSIRRHAHRACSSVRAVDVLQRLEARDRDVLVDLVDAGVDRAELDHLRADLRDEAAVAGAAAWSRARSSMPASSRIAAAPRRSARRAREEGQAAERPGELVVEAVASSTRVTRAPAAIRASTRCEKRKLKSTTTSPGITLLAPVPAWMLLICQLVGGKWSLPPSHSMATSSASAGASAVDRVVRQVRVGDVALHAVDRELAATGCRGGRS